MIEKLITVIVPYYNQPEMLKKHLDSWCAYSGGIFQFVVVDDGSKKPALDVIQAYRDEGLDSGVHLYRVDVDIPWNRGGARNLASREATTPWLLHMDIDHILPPEAAEKLVKRLSSLNPRSWYRFRRFRVGRADETRKKDAISADMEFGEIKPHIDSYLISKDLYWRTGGYDEDYSGCLGGGSPFLKRLESFAPVAQVPQDIFLHVYTRHACPDANANLNRDTSEYTRRRSKKEKERNTTPKNPIRFPWSRVL